MKPVTRSPAATTDIAAAVAYHRQEAGAAIASGFVNALEQAAHLISTWPGSGSPRYAELLGVPGLRSLALARFPYVIFSVDLPDRVEVWRVLHGHRDIPATLRETTA